MSFLNSLKNWFAPSYTTVTFNVPDAIARIQGQSPAELYETQPHLRTVISFIADNIAQVALKEYQRNSDTDRARVTDDTLIRLLHEPNKDMTGFELLRQLASDLCLYDSAYWLVSRDVDSATGWSIRAIPPAWVTSVRGGSVFAPGSYHINNQHGAALDVPASSMIVFHGWNPVDPSAGSSPVRALKDVINEQISAWQYRSQVWQRGGRVGAVLERPANAKPWDDKERARFKRGWQEFTARGAQAGSTPILEDGMKLERIGFSAREDEFSEVTKLSLQTIASVYHVSPVMVGILDNANYSNTREFRKMLYGQTLGPMLRMIEERLNQSLAPMLGTDSNRYLEFDIRAKLSGDFEEQASILSTSVGAPWITRNEARATQNLPALPGGDELITPLNVTKGGQASPQDGGAVQSSIADGKKAAIVNEWRSRVSQAVKSRVGAGKTPDVSEWGRWRDQLTADLAKAGTDVVTAGTTAINEIKRLQEMMKNAD